MKHQDRIDEGERLAREYELGLWSACGGPDVPLEDAAPIAQDAGSAPAPTPLPNIVVEPAQPAPVPVSAQDPAPAPPPVVEQPPAPAAGCDPSYPTLCLPSIPDLDCGEVGAAGFPVLPPDPHGVDRDVDGVGCE